MGYTGSQINPFLRELLSVVVFSPAAETKLGHSLTPSPEQLTDPTFENPLELSFKVR